jgi:Flp pilus assembly protein TadD
MNAISLILRTREDFHKAVGYLQDILKLEPNNGEAWGSLGTLSMPDPYLLRLSSCSC